MGVFKLCQRLLLLFVRRPQFVQLGLDCLALSLFGDPSIARVLLRLLHAHASCLFLLITQLREVRGLVSSTTQLLLVLCILLSLADEWMGDKYNLLSRNCNHFSITFAQKLGLDKNVPSWLVSADEDVESKVERMERMMDKFERQDVKAGLNIQPSLGSLVD